MVPPTWSPDLGDEGVPWALYSLPAGDGVVIHVLQGDIGHAAFAHLSARAAHLQMRYVVLVFKG